MEISEIKAKTASEEYAFLRTDEHLGNNIILLGLGGSHAYGTDTDSSDVDIRGCALNSRREILCGEDFGQVIDVPTDTTVYSFMKLIRLLTGCNPNTIEILGLRPEHYLYLSETGRELLKNRQMFLSRKAAETFGGYAADQFRRLSNKSDRALIPDGLGKRNKNAILHGKLGKHMMHLVRLYMMCIDILERGEVVTYREAEHDLLMSIRSGAYLDSDSQPTADFFALTEDYKRRLDYAAANTSLPESPDTERITEFIMAVNERVILGK